MVAHALHVARLYSEVRKNFGEADSAPVLVSSFFGVFFMRRPLQSPALVSAFFDSVRPEQRETGEAIQRAILETCPHLRAEVKWGNLVYTNDTDNLLSLVLFNANAHLQVFNGVLLLSDFPELQGAGKGMRHVKFRYRQPIDAKLVAELTQASIDAWGRSMR
jgi:uncharacterized protein YdhG (YjbR/CyaY superfamily)